MRKKEKTFETMFLGALKHPCVCACVCVKGDITAIMILLQHRGGSLSPRLFFHLFTSVLWTSNHVMKGVFPSLSVFFLQLPPVSFNPSFLSLLLSSHLVDNSTRVGPLRSEKWHFGSGTSRMVKVMNGHQMSHIRLMLSLLLAHMLSGAAGRSQQNLRPKFN